MQDPHQDNTTRIYNTNPEVYKQSTKDFNFPQDIYNAFLRELPGKKILDAGCAYGRDIERFLDLGLDPYGIEIAENLISIANERARERITHGSILECENIFEANSFNGIFSAASLLHLEREYILEALRQYHALLSMGGVLFLSSKIASHSNTICKESISIPGTIKKYTYFSKEDMENTLEHIGFQVLELNLNQTPSDTWGIFVCKKVMKPILLHTPSSSLALYPERGAIITSLKFGEEELLYQDMLEDTLEDVRKSVRGGIPILFPNSGPVNAEEQELLGFPLGQHGFMRNINDFKVRKQSPSSITLGYTHEASNSPDFPYDFDFEYSISLREQSLRLQTCVHNKSSQDMPIAPGFHPYFPLKSEELIEMRSEQRDWTREIMSQQELWNSGGTLSLDISGIPRVSLKIGTLSFNYELSAGFTRMMIWSLPERDFVCIEPVFGEDGMIARKPQIIESEQSYTYNIEIIKS